MLVRSAMTARQASRAVQQATVVSRAASSVQPVFRQQQRGMATEKQLRTRLASVTSIRKITKAMKMVAAAKLRQVERLLDGARKFSQPLQDGWPKDEREDLPIKKHLIVPMTGDRGLCGAVNSSVVKSCKALLEVDKEAGRDVNIFSLGDKAKAGLERLHGDYISGCITELGKSGPASFQEVALIGEYILANEYDSVTFIHNKYKSAIAYDTTPVTQLSLQLAAGNTEIWNKYEFEGDQRDALQNLYEFRTAVMMFAWVIEGQTSEQSARMTAMDNSTTNAGDMIDRIRLMYNRTRQARITTELIEIISGAAAAEDMKKA